MKIRDTVYAIVKKDEIYVIVEYKVKSIHDSYTNAWEVELKARNMKNAFIKYFYDDNTIFQKDFFPYKEFAIKALLLLNRKELKKSEDRVKKIQKQIDKYEK